MEEARVGIFAKHSSESFAYVRSQIDDKQRKNTIKKTVLNCIKAPRPRRVSNYYFIEFKQLHEV